MDSPHVYGDFLEADFAKWREVIQRNNITP